MEWTAFMCRAVFGADYVPVKCATAKLAGLLPIQIFLLTGTAGTPDDFGTVCNNPADNYAGTFHDNEVVPVEESNNRVGRLFDADDMVRIDVHLLFVHTGQKYHVGT